MATATRASEISEMPPATTPGDESAAAAASAEAGDEESIEAYMDRLLKRVRGETPPGAAESSRGALLLPASPVSAGEPASNPPATAPARKGGFLPRSAAPELSADMSAMRELANDAARSAIESHIRKHTGKQATGKLLGAILTIAAGLLAAFWAWRAGSLGAGLAALLGIGLGVHWTAAALRRIATVKRLNQTQPEAGIAPIALADIPLTTTQVTANDSTPEPERAISSPQ